MGLTDYTLILIGTRSFIHFNYFSYLLLICLSNILMYQESEICIKNIYIDI